MTGDKKQKLFCAGMVAYFAIGAVLLIGLLLKYYGII